MITTNRVETVAVANGQVKKERKGRAKPKTTTPRKMMDKLTKLDVVMAIMAGCATPVLSLAMSTMTGHLAAAGSMMGMMTGMVLICLLIVSTPHCAEAKRSIGWATWQAWSFAVAIDFAIVACELAQVWGADGLTGVTAYVPNMVIVGCVAYSAFLNSYVNMKTLAKKRR